MARPQGDPLLAELLEAGPAAGGSSSAKPAEGEVIDAEYVDMDDKKN